MPRKHREQITVKQLSVTSDGAGGYTSSDTTIGTFRVPVTNIAAGTKMEDGREYLEDTVEFKLRFKEVTFTDADDFTIEWNSKVYKVNSVENYKERDQWLILRCTNET